MLAYTSGSLALQGSILNLKQFFKKDVVESDGRELFYTAVSYRIYLSAAGNTDFTPLVAYRGVDKTANVWDAGGAVVFGRQAVFSQCPLP